MIEGWYGAAAFDSTGAMRFAERGGTVAPTGCSGMLVFACRAGAQPGSLAAFDYSFNDTSGVSFSPSGYTATVGAASWSNAAGNHQYESVVMTVVFDDFLVDGAPFNPVPLPATLPLLAAGLGAIAAAGRRARG